jgi:hypothetical protein
MQTARIKDIDFIYGFPNLIKRKKGGSHTALKKLVAFVETPPEKEASYYEYEAFAVYPCVISR